MYFNITWVSGRLNLTFRNVGSQDQVNPAIIRPNGWNMAHLAFEKYVHKMVWHKVSFLYAELSGLSSLCECWQN